MDFFSLFCEIFGHTRDLVLPNPQGIQCRRCLKYKQLSQPIPNDIYAIGAVRNIGQLEKEME